MSVREDLMKSPLGFGAAPKRSSRSAGRRISKLQSGKEFYLPRVVAPVPTKYWSPRPTVGVAAELHLLHDPLVKEKTFVRTAVPPKRSFAGSDFAWREHRNA